ncbi:hypothetical protein B0T14DRAFT_3142 [Immersiella caudata]|uniref:Uncharacterized protein n=1 Tax=Immersiella caudata TaxID=314043 RepID=A0AA40CAR4_9PEZI|nr:hypothetical protein B0T14DRAFT_3142 [Immersiella caudata]
MVIVARHGDKSCPIKRDRLKLSPQPTDSRSAQTNHDPEHAQPTPPPPSREASHRTNPRPPISSPVSRSRNKSHVLELAAYQRNNALRNPTFPIHPLPASRPNGTLVYPDPALFPRHADEFYSIRNPSDRSRQMLAYLAQFYGIYSQIPGSSGSERQGSSDVDDVELLGHFLGLQEERFIAFRERARLAAKPSTATKRGQPSSS